MRACLLGTFLTLLAAPLSAQSIEQQLDLLTNQWMKAVSEKDDNTLNRLMADDFVAYLPESGKSIQRTEWLRQARLMDNAECEYKSTQIRSYGELAVASGRLLCQGDVKGIGLELDSVVADTWVRRDNQWKVSTRVAAETPSFSGIWKPLAIGAAIPSLIWMWFAFRNRNRSQGSLISSANRPYY
jgi:ketosteroid isomerase-like protein